MSQDRPCRKLPVVAIDGPAGSGKSTTARLVARHLGYRYLDTGAMYRAVTLKALRLGMDLRDEEALGKLAESCDIQFCERDGTLRVLLDGEDVTEAIRAPEVGRRIGPVADNVHVRRVLVERQRALGAAGGVVAEGRDMGTVVFPDAEVKVFLTASREERVRRRWHELRAKGLDLPLEEVEAEIRKRDGEDVSRPVGALRKAPDAVELDTTRLSVEEQVAKVVELVRQAEQRLGAGEC
ncbi:MAG: (d)CMP kinase [candidate division KSB1 bacterium]|nr:(d)CMP kinase [candidate division KSB1 bacterium]